MLNASEWSPAAVNENEVGRVIGIGLDMSTGWVAVKEFTLSPQPGYVVNNKISVL